MIKNTDFGKTIFCQITRINVVIFKTPMLRQYQQNNNITTKYSDTYKTAQHNLANLV